MRLPFRVPPPPSPPARPPGKRPAACRRSRFDRPLRGGGPRRDVHQDLVQQPRLRRRHLSSGSTDHWVDGELDVNCVKHTDSGLAFLRCASDRFEFQSDFDPISQPSTFPLKSFCFASKNISNRSVEVSNPKLQSLRGSGVAPVSVLHKRPSFLM